jgi:antitoxin (DNA-binding transcriptional repressor) of toxin-antitoxin stability system
MQIVNIHQAKTQLSKLIELAVRGEAFIIARAGKPLVRVSRIDVPALSKARRLGFMLGEIAVPDDFDRMGAEEIDLLFMGTE